MTAHTSAPLYFVPMASPAKMPASSTLCQRACTSQRHHHQTASKVKSDSARSVVTKRLWAMRFGSKTASSNASHAARAPIICRAAKKIADTSSTPSSVTIHRARSSMAWASLPLSHTKMSEKRKRSPAAQLGWSVGRVIVSSPSKGRAAISPASGG